MPLNNSGVNQVTSANTDISVANGTSTPELTLNVGTSANKIVKLDGSARLPAVDGSQLTNISGSTDVSYINQQQLIQNIDILRCLADASLAISDYSTMFCDILSDSSGYSNTVDTGGSTTAYFDSTNKLYKNSSFTDSTEAHNQALNNGNWNNTGNTTKSGMKINCTTACSVVSVTKDGSCTADTCCLCDASKNELATASFSSNLATFSTPQSLSASTDYYLLVRSSSNYTAVKKDVGVSFPYTSTNIDWTGGVDNAGVDSNAHMVNIVSCVTRAGATPANKIMQTNTITVSGNLTAYQLYSKKTLAGSGTVQYKVSFDNGSTWTSAKELNTKYTNATTGTSIKLQILLNGSGSGNTSQIENYSMMVWY